MTEGRSCPLAYRYEPASLCQDGEQVSEDVLYIVGGLYGNPLALDEIERMAAAEAQAGRQVRLVFNGDFNWFNASDELFRDINHRVLAHTASLGNVEFELASASDGAGCGCAYPEFVDQSVVERSNRIMMRLQSVANAHPDIQEGLSALPRYRCLLFGGLNILVLHGDPESLAGWGLAHESFSAGNDSELRRWLDATGADVIACTHTCLPVLWTSSAADRSGVVVNNGSAGMGNLKEDGRGLITRIAAGPSPQAAVASHEVAGMAVSLLPVAFDRAAWIERFDRLWPAGSDASESYRERILRGTDLGPEQVVFPSKSS